MGTGKIVTLVLSGGGLPDVEATVLFGSGLRPESPLNLSPNIFPDLLPHVSGTWKTVLF